MFNIAHISTFDVNFNIFMMFKPKYIVIRTRFFCSILAGGTSHFYSFYSVNVLARADFWYDNFGLASRAQAKNSRKYPVNLLMDFDQIYVKIMS